MQKPLRFEGNPSCTSQCGKLSRVSDFCATPVRLASARTAPEVAISKRTDAHADAASDQRGKIGLSPMLLATSALLAGSSCQPILRCGNVRCSLELPDGPSESISPLELKLSLRACEQTNATTRPKR